MTNLEDDPELSYAYTSINFIDSRVLFTYYVGKKQVAPDEKPSKTVYSLKLKSVPVEWLYH